MDSVVKIRECRWCHSEYYLSDGGANIVPTNVPKPPGVHTQDKSPSLTKLFANDNAGDSSTNIGDVVRRLAES